jgi:hypothetical protein
MGGGGDEGDKGSNFWPWLGRERRGPRLVKIYIYISQKYAL